MKNFRFDLTPMQVKLLHYIINETYVRLSHAAVVRKQITGKQILFDSALVDIMCLSHEFDLQVSKYLDELGFNSISDLDE